MHVCYVYICMHMYVSPSRTFCHSGSAVFTPLYVAQTAVTLIYHDLGRVIWLEFDGRTLHCREFQAPVWAIWCVSCVCVCMYRCVHDSALHCWQFQYCVAFMHCIHTHIRFIACKCINALTTNNYYLCMYACMWILRHLHCIFYLSCTNNGLMNSKLS